MPGSVLARARALAQAGLVLGHFAARPILVQVAGPQSVRGVQRCDLGSGANRPGVGPDPVYWYDFTGAGVRVAFRSAPGVHADPGLVQVYVADSGVDAEQMDFETLTGGPSRVLQGTSFYPASWLGLPGNTDQSITAPTSPV